MKRVLNLLAVCLTAFLGQGIAAQTTFSYSGTIENYTVPSGVTSIQIECKGGQGGYSNGGQGAIMVGTFAVTPGQVLEILVGGQGAVNGSSSNEGGAGGGGSFVVDQSTVTPLIVAGGGGGGCDGTSFETSFSQPYDAAITDAQLGEDGATTTAGTGGGSGGNGGDAGQVDCCLTDNVGGSGGGGFFTNGEAGSPGEGSGINSEGGFAYVNGGAGGICGVASSSYPIPSGSGGFGGGGGSAMDNAFRAGGGGGYSGGQGAAYINTTTGYIWGGGGGSYNTGTDQVNSIGHTGDGEIIITELCTGLTFTVSDDTVCVGDEVILDASSTSGGTVSWDGGVSNGVAFTPPAGTTTYNATSTEAEDCGLSITIFVGDLPTVDAGTNITFCPGEEVTLNASGTATDWSWDGGVTDGVAFTAPSGTTTYTLTGTIDSTGCEAMDMVDVSETIINNTITATGTDLVSNQAGAAYQWLECPALTPVAGETAQTYASVPEGDFAVEVTLDGCVDTSACQIVHVGLTDQEIPVKIYPNPSSGQFQIEMVGAYSYEVTTLQGRVIMNNSAEGNEIIDLTIEANGTYLLSIQSDEGEFKILLVKE